MQLAEQSRSERLARVRVCYITCIAVVAALILPGCSSSQWIRQRRQPALPIAAELELFSWRGPHTTPRTRQLMRRYDLLTVADKNPEQALTQLMESELALTSPEHVFAIAEIAFLAGRKADQRKHWGEALDLYGISVANAYDYLLNEQFDRVRNPYDPQFRQASDLYNAALEGVLRIVSRQGHLRPGAAHLVATRTQEYELQIVCRGPWLPADIADLKFVSDYDSQGLKNQYRTFGLGVPLIAVHSSHPGNSPAEKYYSPGMSVPITAFLRVLPGQAVKSRDGCVRHVCIVELHDPLTSTDVSVNDRLVPLETNLSTPLAYCLNDPAFQQANTATRGLLNPAKSQETQGLYLLEPYDPNKIPVLMIHGLWSSLITWVEMFNDLRGVPEIRDNFQFWFYMYPSGQPLLLTATQLRAELADARQLLDPCGTNGNLDQMVLVGHSMGGLVARLQTMESGEAFWRLLSDTPFQEFEGTDEEKDELRKSLFFNANPSIRRVVTIASPHRGSSFSNEATQWLGRKVIRLPEMVRRTRDRLALQAIPPNGRGLLEIQTSIDSLSPTSPILEVMQTASAAPWVEYHNIIGVVSEDRVLSRVTGQSDGVVDVDSARLKNATSELVVNADHLNIHRHPRTVLEVQRILLRHLNQAGRLGMGGAPAPVVPLPRAAVADPTLLPHLAAPEMEEVQTVEEVQTIESELPVP